MNAVQFGYAGKWSPNLQAVQQAAGLVKSDPTPVGVEVLGVNNGMAPVYRVATQNEYQQAAQGGRIVFTAEA